MHGLGVRGRVHRHRLECQLAAGPLDTERDLATIGDEDFLEQTTHSRISSFAVFHRRAVGTKMRATVPALGALIWLNVFIASISSSVWPAVTRWPTVTKGGAPGSGER